MSILESLAGGHPVAAGIVATLTLLLGYHWVVSVHFPASLPRVREKPGARAFSWRTRLDYYVDCKSLFFEAYEKVRSDACFSPRLSWREEYTKIWLGRRR